MKNIPKENKPTCNMSSKIDIEKGVRSSQDISFNIHISISQEIIDLRQIISNHKYNKYNDNHKEENIVTIECNQQITFYVILKQLSMIPLIKLNCIKLIVEQEQEITNYNETVFKYLSNEYLSSIYIKLCLNDEWNNNNYKLPKIISIDNLIDKLIIETDKKCKKLNNCKSFEILRLEYDIMNNDILSKFVDIDALIDDHGNDIAMIESMVIPYLSSNKNQIINLFSNKLEKMDNDLQKVHNKWLIKSNQIENYLQNALNQRVETMEKKYKLWNTKQVLQWIQYIINDNITFDYKDIKTLKILNIAGINIQNIVFDTLQNIGIHDQIQQNFVITSIHNLIAKYG